ncbi:MAG TPA: nitrogenase component 1 [Chloroflexia bacterium]|nr:nitrogenase component 1 [Chloroflexia bacterium]
MPDKITELKTGRTINLVAKGGEEVTVGDGKGECSMHSATMCPAFGSLRVTMRIEGMVPVLVGAVGCLYGLDFVSHFYAANKPIVSPSLTARELVQSDLTDKVMDIINDVVKHEEPRMIAVMSLCTPETSGLHLELLPRQIGQTEVIPMRVPAYGVPTHAEAKDVAISQIIKRLGENMVEKGQEEAIASDGLVTVGEVFPTDPLQLGAVLQRFGIKHVAHLPHKELNAFFEAPKARVAALLHPFYDRTVKELGLLGVKPLYSAPVGAHGTYNWIKNLGALLRLSARKVEEVADDEAQKVADELDASRMDGVRIMIAGYEGSEMLFARLMVEAGADVCYVSTSVRNGPGTKEDQAWLAEHGVEVLFRKRHEDDLMALEKLSPDLVVGSSNLEAVAKRRGIPAVYYTNIVAARPILLSTGVRPLVEHMQTVLKGASTFNYMRDFFAETLAEDPVREAIKLSI